MWRRQHAPANDPRAPGLRTDRDGPEARLDALLQDERMQRILGNDGPPHALMQRVARAVRREAAEPRAQRCTAPAPASARVAKLSRV